MNEEDLIEEMRWSILEHKREADILEKRIQDIYKKRRETCTHPDMQLTLGSAFCPHCKFSRDRGI